LAKGADLAHEYTVEIKRAIFSKETYEIFEKY